MDLFPLQNSFREHQHRSVEEIFRDTAGHQFLNGAMLAIFSVAFGIFVKEFKPSMARIIMLIILVVPAGRSISSMVNAIMESSSTIACKKEKATLTAIIVDDILKERKEGKAPSI